MKALFICLMLVLHWPLLAQTRSIKENLGPAVNRENDQILPVFSLDGQTLYFSENGVNGRYEIWFSRRNEDSTWQPKQRSVDMNPPTEGSKYVFAQAENDLLLVNGWFDQTDEGWEQSKGLSWFVPSENSYTRLDIPELQTQAKGRFVNAFLHCATKTLLLSYAVDERRNLYVCKPQNPKANWIDLRWQTPQKLPSPLNTEFDDTTPFMDDDGESLYFASNRPGGYGQEDIYVSRRLDDTWLNWSPPENLGFRVNSNFAEIYYCISPLRDFSYFVSYKHSYGSGDIFRLQIESPQPEDTTEFVDSTQILASIDSSDTEITIEPVPQANNTEVTELSIEEYSSNNLVFLVDRSGSMKSSSKLPLLKRSLKRLIRELRDIDRLTLISFSDSAIIHFTTNGVTQKDSLYTLIDSLVSSGATKANRGLQLAYEYTNQNFLEDGNNEIILVTDGQFNLSAQDRLRIERNERIILSAVGLGNDRKALATLRKLASKANGSFIQIRNEESGTEALLEEVKERSRKK